MNAGHLAPPMIEIDPAGKVVNSWGDQDLLEDRLHSCHFDKDNNVWIGSSPSGMVQKYSHDGSKLLLQIGKKGVFDSSDGTPRASRSIPTPLNSSCHPASLSIGKTERCSCPMAKALAATVASR